jgi:hypothetical protein
MFCERRIELVAGYAAAVAAYYSSVRELEAGLITGSEEIYAKNLKATEEARAVCEAARERLHSPNPSVNVPGDPDGRSGISHRIFRLNFLKIFHAANKLLNRHGRLHQRRIAGPE